MLELPEQKTIPPEPGCPTSFHEALPEENYHQWYWMIRATHFLNAFNVDILRRSLYWPDTIIRLADSREKTAAELLRQAEEFRLAISIENRKGFFCWNSAVQELAKKKLFGENPAETDRNLFIFMLNEARTSLLRQKDMAEHSILGFKFTPADFIDLLFYTQQLEALLPEDQQKLIQPTAAELSSTGVKIEE